MKTLRHNKDIEKYSSAFTLSDMEIFIFPELLYSLVLANIMSPIIWRWKSDSWFSNIENKSFNYKVNRVKQYIMDHTMFNLDLDTWGLTTKTAEINRFRQFVDIETLKQSNALFGYEGDKYYFDIDIRKHFGLDKYSSEVIPYWKTETVEAMMAFKLKKDYNIAAGECVSFSALYVAALFILAKIPLDDIFLISTPLHSQNFISENEGLFTNNRRIVTKKMWFNGTELSQKARRAIENEKITIVANLSGYVHTMYDTATIDKVAYSKFTDSLTKFVNTDFSFEMFINFIRQHSQYHTLFQYCNKRNGTDAYIDLQTIFEYERYSKNIFSNESRNALIAEIPHEKTLPIPYPDKILLNDFEHFIDTKHIGETAVAKQFFDNESYLHLIDKKTIYTIFDGIEHFISLTPRLPNPNKIYDTLQPRLNIDTDMSRTEIIDYLHHAADKNAVADLAFYTFRDMNTIDWTPFAMAAWQRNPISVEKLKHLSVYERAELLKRMNNKSIYEGNRLAQPDEAWNFGTADGIEKAILLANTIINTEHDSNITIEIKNKTAKLTTTDYGTFAFSTEKDIEGNLVPTMQEAE